MGDPMIIDNESMQMLIELLMNNCIFMIEDKRSAYHHNYYIRNIIIKFNNIEYELFPRINISNPLMGKNEDEKEKIIEYVKKLLCNRSLIDIQFALKNYVDRTNYRSKMRDHGKLVPPSDIYSSNVNNYLDKVIMKAELKILTNKINDLSDKMAMMIDYLTLAQPTNKI